jgi:hypothetical protein
VQQQVAAVGRNKRRSMQVHAAVGALLRDNGQDHQRAFLDGEGILGLLEPGQVPKAKALLGLANKDKAHAAARAGDRALQVRAQQLRGSPNLSSRGCVATVHQRSHQPPYSWLRALSSGA